MAFNRGACFQCRMRAQTGNPVTVLSCACGWTASFCKTCGGRKRVKAEIAEHETTCLNARRKAEIDRRVAARSGRITMPEPPPRPTLRSV